QHHDRHVAVRPQLAADVRARNPRQHHVEDDDVVAPPSRRLERGGAVALLVDVKALAPQRERDDVQDARIVVHDEDARRLGAVHAAGTSSRTRARWSTIRTRVPRPGAESRSIWPPRLRTDWRTIASPSPKPSASRSRPR